ncbi:hypothetical protein [Pedobacter frigoris]|uniref:Exo-alpha-sialidase n=1 Tax=Pedobacter frigoris TaxID=2571272 RepID=A0A4U1CPD3_9SPHI|nr:hypothetical protein [Pedobacter frigoris]TKC08625.1 hypothetical protein FA047_00555 [Pedobacter frigoris]
MKKIYLLMSFLFFLIACEKNDDSKFVEVETVFDDPDWIRLKVPAGGEIHSVAGSIDDTLLVTTLAKAYFTADGGKTWKESKNFSGTVPGLLTSKDTIFAFIASGFDPAMGRKYAGSPTSYTLNKGLTWQSYHDGARFIQTGVATSKKDLTTYRLKYSSGADTEGNGTNWVLRTTIDRIKRNGEASQFEHPVKDHQPLNLHMDSQDKLYISTGGSFSKTGVYVGASVTSPAYVYVSKTEL